MRERQSVLEYKQAIRPISLDVSERDVETRHGVDPEEVDGKPERPGGSFGGAQLRSGRGVPRVPKDRDALKPRNNLAKQFQPLPAEIRDHQRGAGDIGLGMRQIGHESGSDVITNTQHDDWDRRCRSLGGDRLLGSHRHDHIDLQPDEFARESWNLLRPVAGVSVFDHEVPALDISEVAESPEELGRQFRRVWLLIRSFPQETNPPDLSRLALRGAW
jgi:hypothetical protein